MVRSSPARDSFSFTQSTLNTSNFFKNADMDAFDPDMSITSDLDDKKEDQDTRSSNLFSNLVSYKSPALKNATNSFSFNKSKTKNASMFNKPKEVSFSRKAKSPDVHEDTRDDNSTIDENPNYPNFEHETSPCKNSDFQGDNDDKKEAESLSKSRDLLLKSVEEHELQIADSRRQLGKLKKENSDLLTKEQTLTDQLKEEYKNREYAQEKLDQLTVFYKGLDEASKKQLQDSQTLKNNFEDQSNHMTKTLKEQGSRLVTAEAEIFQYKQEIADYSKEIKELKERIAKLASDLEMTRDDLFSQKEKYMEDMSDMRAKGLDQVDKIKEQEKEISDLREQETSLREQLQSVETKLDGTENELSSRSAELADTKSRNFELEKNLIDSQSDVFREKENVRQIGEAYNKLEKNTQRYTHLLRILTNQLREKFPCCQISSQELTDFATPLDQIEADIKSKISGLMSSFDDLQSDLNQQKAILNSKNAEFESHQSETRNLRENLQEKEEYIRKIENELREKDGSKDVISERLETILNELLEKNKLIDEIKLELEESATALLKAEAKVKETQEQYEKDKKETGIVLEARENEITMAYKENCRKLEKMEKALESKEASHNKADKQKEKKINDLTTQMDKLKLKVSEVTSERKLEEQIDAAADMYKTAKKDLDATRKELKASKAKQEELIKEIRQLKSLERKNVDELYDNFDNELPPSSAQIEHGDRTDSPRARKTCKAKTTPAKKVGIKKRKVQFNEEDTPKSVRETPMRNRATPNARSKLRLQMLDDDQASSITDSVFGF
ncbi:hypothetical protein Ciccas_008284 [Cichlidogyrus casuarinus]|uniref:Synaptonemal complex protein 1 n=1 Tax=Cichlidogyrus casuarinus TaxID=1844966 RepID=A0ABD2Q0H9_9PLAT